MKFSKLPGAVCTRPSHSAMAPSGSFPDAASLRGVGVAPVSTLRLLISFHLFLERGVDSGEHGGPVNTIGDTIDFVTEHFPFNRVAM